MDAAIAHSGVLLFYATAALALVAGLVVIGQRSASYSAFALIVVLCCLSVIYGLLGSPFIAVLQIVVYAGAIMVLFLFVIMLLNVQREAHPRGERLALKLSAALLAVLVGAEIATALHRAAVPAGPVGYEASVRSVAQQLFSVHFLYVFEATSVLILAALVGAVALAKKEP
jgi:NADH-quinone oxidoreductase subunit J